MASTAEKHYDVVVVGDGLSGLQAAHSVQAAGFNVCVVEATNRIGGKTLTAQSCERGFNDLGASWINETDQGEIFKLYKRYGVGTLIQRDHGDALIQSADGSITKAPFRQPPVRLASSGLCTRILINDTVGKPICATRTARRISNHMLADRLGRLDQKCPPERSINSPSANFVFKNPNRRTH